MSESRGWGKTVMGWFVTDGAGETSAEPASDVSGDASGAAPSDAERLISKYADAPGPAGAVPPIVNGPVDFAQVFEAAGVDAGERDQVAKAQELLRSLPAETPAPVKRQIVEAALKAFGVPTATIIEAAVEEIRALEAHIQAGQSQAQRAVEEGNRRIAGLEAEVARVREAMEQASAEQEARVRAVNVEKLKVQPVLEFFGQEVVAQVVQDSAKLKPSR